MGTPWSRIDWDTAVACTRQADWDGLLSAFAVLPGHARDDLVGPFAATLDAALDQARTDERVVALYFEVEPPRTGVFLCLDYLPEPDWPADFEHWVDGPALPDDELDEVTASALALAAFGQALQRRGPLSYPVAIGVHDCPVLYPPLPPGAMAPEDRPRTVLPEIRPEGWYRLEPVDGGHGGTDVDDAGVNWLHAAFRWYRAGSPGHSREEPAPPPLLVLVRGRFEDCLQTVTGPYPVSRRLAEALGDQVELSPVTVRDRRTGEERPYAVLRPRLRLSEPVDPADLAGVALLDVRYRQWHRQGLAVVSGSLLADLAANGCLAGVRAVPVEFTDG